MYAGNALCILSCICYHHVTCSGEMLIPSDRHTVYLDVSSRHSNPRRDSATRHAQHMILIKLQALMTIARVSPSRCTARAFYATAGGAAPTGDGDGSRGRGSRGRGSTHDVPMLTLNQVHHPIALRALFFLESKPHFHPFFFFLFLPLLVHATKYTHLYSSFSATGFSTYTAQSCAL